MITDSFDATVDPSHGPGYFITEDVMQMLVNLEGKAWDALSALQASDRPQAAKMTDEQFQRHTRIDAINALKDGLQAI